MAGEAEKPRSIHPLVATAAGAVIVVSALGAVTLIRDQVWAQRNTEQQSGPAAVAQAGGTAPGPAAAAPEPAPVPRHPTPAARPPAVHPKPATPVATQSGSPTASPSAALPAPPPGAPPAPPPDAVAAAAPVPCPDCAVVEDVRAIRSAGEGTGVGAVAGGVLGAIVGNQIGRGSGRDAARVVGIVGGAIAGHQIEKQARASTQYQVDLRMDNGELRSVMLPGDPGLTVGQRVHAVGQQITVDPALAPPRG